MRIHSNTAATSMHKHRSRTMGMPAEARAWFNRETIPAKMGALALVPSVGTNLPPSTTFKL